jgi:hypothetical protein
MAHDVEINPVLGLAILRLSGHVMFGDLAAAARALGADPRFVPTYALLLDLREATDVTLTREEMQSLARITPVAATSRRAILVGRTSVYGMARMYEMIRENQTSMDTVRACRTVAEASEWLGVSLTDDVV